MALALRVLRLPATAAGAVYKANAGMLSHQAQGQLQWQCKRGCNFRMFTTASSEHKKGNTTNVSTTSITKSFGEIDKPAKSPNALCRGEMSSSHKAKAQGEALEEVGASAEQKDNASSSASSTSTTKQKLSPEVVRQNVQGYMFTRYFDIVKNYDRVLEKNFPSAVKVYRVFFDGVKDFYADMKRYLKIARIVNSSPKGLAALNRKELELYMQMPRDMIKVAPALIGSSLPMVGYVIFPLVFMYPRTLLTSHFWTGQQRCEFQQISIRDRLRFNRPVFRHLQSRQRSVRSQDYYPQLKKALGLMGSGFHPSVEALLDLKDVFAKAPFSLQTLSGKHVKLLCQMHGLRTGWFKRHRLYEHAFLVHHMDLAIGREGGVHNMSPEAIHNACYIRGLNPDTLSNEEMVEWMRNWIQVSTSIQEQHISLFLHLPIFLAYNHPNNWRLIYGDAIGK